MRETGLAISVQGCSLIRVVLVLIFGTFNFGFLHHFFPAVSRNNLFARNEQFVAKRIRSEFFLRFVEIEKLFAFRKSCHVLQKNYFGATHQPN